MLFENPEAVSLLFENPGRLLFYNFVSEARKIILYIYIYIYICEIADIVDNISMGLK